MIQMHSCRISAGNCCMANMSLDHGKAEYGVEATFDGTTTTTREEVMRGQRLGTSTKRMYTADCIVQMDSVNTVTVQIVEDLGQLDVGLGVAARHQKAYSWYLGVSVFQDRLVGEKEAELEPPLLLGFRWRRWWVGISGASVSLREFRLDDWGFGVGSGRKTDDPLGVGRDVTVGEQDRGLGRFHMHPMHQTLYKACVPVFFQQPKAGFRMMYERVCLWVGEDESKEFGDIVQTTNASSQVSNLLVFYMRGERQAAIYAIGGWVQAGNTTTIIDSAVLYLRRKLAHWPAQEISNGGCDIEWERRKGHDAILQRSRSESAEKSEFFLQSWKE